MQKLGPFNIFQIIWGFIRYMFKALANGTDIMAEYQKECNKNAEMLTKLVLNSGLDLSLLLDPVTGKPINLDNLDDSI